MRRSPGHGGSWMHTLTLKEALKGQWEMTKDWIRNLFCLAFLLGVACDQSTDDCDDTIATAPQPVIRLPTEETFAQCAEHIEEALDCVYAGDDAPFGCLVIPEAGWFYRQWAECEQQRCWDSEEPETCILIDAGYSPCPALQQACEDPTSVFNW